MIANETKESKNAIQVRRINWIDVSRGLAFLMVIYSHLELCDDSIMRYFSPVFLTTFFFVSGYLYKDDLPFKTILEQRTRTLLLPFLFLGFIMIGLSHILTFNSPKPLFSQIKGLLLQNGENELLWFIAALYVCSIAFYFVLRYTKNKKSLFALIFVLFISNCLITRNITPPSLPIAV